VDEEKWIRFVIGSTRKLKSIKLQFFESVTVLVVMPVKREKGVKTNQIERSEII
jgi:hypothetical protein